MRLWPPYIRLEEPEAMVRSKSRTHSSRSRSRSQSRSRSRTRSRSRSRTRSRKKRYSSRSRSRSYSRSRSRDRNYPREYRRDYRGNRGMRRPYGFRGRGRGFYPGGGRFQHRGGFRPNWHNRRYSHSPRRERSRSRTPKRRSPSQRSRSQSRRSSGSRDSSGSSSSSSSHSSPSPTSARRRPPQEKSGEGGEGPGGGEGNGERPTVKSELKRPVLVSDGWVGISAYDDGSPSPSSALPGPSSSHPASSVQPHSPGSAPGVYSPTHSAQGRSPGQVFSAPTGSRGGLRNKQDVQKTGRFFKRFVEEEGDRGPALQDRGAAVWVSEGTKESSQVKGGWGAAEGEKGVKTKKESVPFLGDSPAQPGEEEEDEEEDESQAYRQPYKFRLSGQSEPVKTYLGEAQWMAENQEESGRYKSKVLKAGREGAGGCQFKDPGFVLKRAGAEGHAEEGPGADRRGRREDATPTTSWHAKELVTQGPLLQKVVEVRDEAEAPGPEVKVKLGAKAFDNVSSVASDRSLASVLAQAQCGRREHGFRSVFEHIKRPQALKSSAESYVLHIVSLVHHVREHYFKSTGVTLHERFTVYQKAAVEQEARHKSPEIHRRIDISPSAFKKVRLFKEDVKGERKSRSDSVDLRHSIDRRRKERSREGDDRRDSRDPSPSGKPEKPGKDFKDYKDYKSLKEESGNECFAPFVG
ncbi:hypothetical protein COCON_G00099120 [Conger conger]|uniref:Thyroid hormone receptor-associated protein 3 n=1 Tax=Conger conger TaxID=82655 RepID=A0A9Q1I1H2_CONCO|nr:hypothetical protein COCON_G00099120 [Conger conger]